MAKHARRVETKVKAATGGAGAGVVLSGLIVWALDALFWPAPGAEVPDPVVLAIGLIVPTVVTFAAGYQARHTVRADEEKSA